MVQVTWKKVVTYLEINVPLASHLLGITNERF